MSDMSDGLAENWRGKLFIVTPLRLYGELLKGHLERIPATECVVVSSTISEENISELSIGYECVALLDCSRTAVSEIPDSVARQVEKFGSECRLVVLDAERGRNIENDVLSAGAMGVFYEADSPDTLLKGIKAVMAGELWYPRRFLSEQITSNRKRQNRFSSSPMVNKLTQRELDILTVLGTGVRNEEIADKLNISAHTVKAHLYNIYRKIGVNSRAQALIWASRHFPR